MISTEFLGCHSRGSFHKDDNRVLPAKAGLKRSAGAANTGHWVGRVL
jgi:hypothetical protein